MTLFTATAPTSSMCSVRGSCYNFPVPSPSYSLPNWNSGSAQVLPLAVRRKLRVWQLKAHFWKESSEDDAAHAIEPYTAFPIEEEDPFCHAFILTEITQPDGRFEKILLSTAGDLDVYEVQALYAKGGYGGRSPSKLAIALENSYMVATLHSIKKSPDADGKDSMELIGMARVTSDHAVFATIWDVIVDPSYQGQGFGKALIEQVIRALRHRGIPNISLFAHGKVVDFYQNLGFEPDSRGFKGMYWSPTF